MTRFFGLPPRKIARNGLEYRMRQRHTGAQKLCPKLSHRPEADEVCYNAARYFMAASRTNWPIDATEKQGRYRSIQVRTNICSVSFLSPRSQQSLLERRRSRRHPRPLGGMVVAVGTAVVGDGTAAAGIAAGDGAVVGGAPRATTVSTAIRPIMAAESAGHADRFLTLAIRRAAPDRKVRGLITTSARMEHLICETLDADCDTGSLRWLARDLDSPNAVGD